MIKKLFITLAIIISAALFFSCSQSTEKKIAGTWQVEDVKFDAKSPMSEGQVKSAKESAKSVSYELMEDKNAKIRVGTTVLTGNWEYREADAGVYMSFTGSFDTVLIGRFDEGKLINEATRPDLKITTIFVKEEK